MTATAASAFADASARAAGLAQMQARVMDAENLELEVSSTSGLKRCPPNGAWAPPTEAGSESPTKERVAVASKPG